MKVLQQITEELARKHELDFFNVNEHGDLVFGDIAFRLMPIPEGLKGHLGTRNQTLAVIEEVNGRLPGSSLTEADLQLDSYKTLQDMFIEKEIELYKPTTAKIEPKVPRGGRPQKGFVWIKPKRRYNTQESLDRVIQDGYQRHLTPTESSEIYIGRQEGTLPRSIIPIYEDMVDQSGEFNGLMRVLTKKEKRYLVLHNTVKDGTYDIGTFDFQPIEIGDLQGGTEFTLAQIDKVAPEVVKRFYGRELKHLPRISREGEIGPYSESVMYSVIRIPRQDSVLPVINFRYGAGLSFNCFGVDNASRGISKNK